MTPLERWDIFCRVVDNYGDIGVCWRLARQLLSEYGVQLRLWVDELAAFARLCPEIDTGQDVQRVRGVEVHRWQADFPPVEPGDVVIETFACHLPESFVQAMAARHPAPVWVNLDYLSAESWVAEYHALPSPHPRLPLVKTFFFPGFAENTGGLLCEAGLERRRHEFLCSAIDQAAFWNRLGQVPPPPETLCISLFAYTAQPALLRAWQDGDQAICCLAVENRHSAAIESFTGSPWRSGTVFQRGRLEIRCLPFLEQDDYDRLLWLCNLNCVRGEDSFLRAQWAARPLLWQIYPQEEAAHLVKLDAFLEIYCAGLSARQSAIVRRLHAAWNGENPVFSPEIWTDYCKILPELILHAENWQKKQAKQQDLCASLVHFCRSKGIMCG